jgi:hypothetical protein
MSHRRSGKQKKRRPEWNGYIMRRGRSIEGGMLSRKATNNWKAEDEI